MDTQQDPGGGHAVPSVSPVVAGEGEPDFKSGQVGRRTVFAVLLGGAVLALLAALYPQIKRAMAPARRVREGNREGGTD